MAFYSAALMLFFGLAWIRPFWKRTPSRYVWGVLFILTGYAYLFTSTLPHPWNIPVGLTEFCLSGLGVAGLSEPGNGDDVRAFVRKLRKKD